MPAPSCKGRESARWRGSCAGAWRTLRARPRMQVYFALTCSAMSSVCTLLFVGQFWAGMRTQKRSLWQRSDLWRCMTMSLESMR